MLLPKNTVSSPTVVSSFLALPTALLWWRKCNNVPSSTQSMGLVGNWTFYSSNTRLKNHRKKRWVKGEVRGTKRLFWYRVFGKIPSFRIAKKKVNTRIHHPPKQIKIRLQNGKMQNDPNWEHNFKNAFFWTFDRSECGSSIFGSKTPFGVKCEIRTTTTKITLRDAIYGCAALFHWGVEFFRPPCFRRLSRTHYANAAAAFFSFSLRAMPSILSSSSSTSLCPFKAAT